MEVSLASLPHLQHIYLKPLVKLIVNYLTVNKKKYTEITLATWNVQTRSEKMERVGDK
jgi:hypothetical protein